VARLLAAHALVGQRRQHRLDARILRAARAVQHYALAGAQREQGTFGEAAEFHLLVEAKPNGLLVRVRTKNRAAPERMADARWRLDALARAGDPIAHYDELIRESAGRRDISGLGLARIPAESEMELRYATDQDWLIVTAEGSTSKQVNE